MLCQRQSIDEPTAPNACHHLRNFCTVLSVRLDIGPKEPLHCIAMHDLLLHILDTGRYMEATMQAHTFNLVSMQCYAA